MKESRDFAIVSHINDHFNDLREDLSNVDSFDDFVAKKERRRAILFDFLQIGELTNQLSKSFRESFNNKDAERLIAIRNRIVHGYSTIRDDIIFNTLKNQLASFIDELNSFSHNYYREQLKKLLGEKVKVFIDRPIGFNHENIIYPINYGYIENITALDGKFQDAYVIDELTPITESMTGYVIAIIERTNDIEDKIVVSISGTTISDKEIEEKTYFQEQFFEHKIIIK